MSKTLEELGYEKILDDEYEAIYKNGFCDTIVFRKLTRSTSIICCYNAHQVITMEELKAIYKQCEDLGWI